MDSFMKMPIFVNMATEKSSIKSMEKSSTKASDPASFIDITSMSPEYINSHEPVCSCLVTYFLPEPSDPNFRQASAQEIALDERMTYCRHMAAWFLHEKYYKQTADK